MTDYSIYTDVGDREINEDSVKTERRSINGKECSLFVLCDGLGGHGRGEVASALFCETAVECFKAADDIENLLPQIFKEGQKRILELQEKEHAKTEMKTTAVVLLIADDWIQWGHVGDSRLYRFSKLRLIERTLDHSVPQILVSAGDIKESEIRNHPDRNRLLRVIGEEWEGEGYSLSEKIRRKGGERFLMCSDGFWENIIEKKMWWMMLQSKSAEVWLGKMKEEVKQNGAGKNMDNNTAIVVML